jgi:predicted lipid-binding transport protein (Tim44 family)
MLGADMRGILQHDLDELKNKKQINRLENISVRRAEIVNTWYEDDKEYSTLRLTANLLDYTVDEANGQLIQGSDSVPVKFEENWTFAKANNRNTWQLVGIEQV